MFSSSQSSAKKCDFAPPRPPNAPLYRAGTSSGSKTGSVSILSVLLFLADDDTLDLVEERLAIWTGERSLREIRHALLQETQRCGHLRSVHGLFEHPKCMTRK